MFQKKNLLRAGIVLASSNAVAAQAAEEVHDEDVLQEIVISAPFAESEAETVLPVGILTGEALSEKVSNSLGDTLKNEIGVNSASFGTGVGQPIIRGQTGNRLPPRTVRWTIRGEGRR